MKTNKVEKVMKVKGLKREGRLRKAKDKRSEEMIRDDKGELVEKGQVVVRKGKGSLRGRKVRTKKL